MCQRVATNLELLTSSGLSWFLFTRTSRDLQGRGAALGQVLGASGKGLGGG